MSIKQEIEKIKNDVIEMVRQDTEQEAKGYGSGINEYDFSGLTDEELKTFCYLLDKAKVKNERMKKQ